MGLAGHGYDLTWCERSMRDDTDDENHPGTTPPSRTRQQHPVRVAELENAVDDDDLAAVADRNDAAHALTRLLPHYLLGVRGAGACGHGHASSPSADLKAASEYDWFAENAGHSCSRLSGAPSKSGDVCQIVGWGLQAMAMT